MLLRKAVYGIRGTIIKSMLIICIQPLTITAIILYLFIIIIQILLLNHHFKKALNMLLHCMNLLWMKCNTLIPFSRHR
jgi:hypothetical protein